MIGWLQAVKPHCYKFMNFGYLVKESPFMLLILSGQLLD